MHSRSLTARSTLAISTVPIAIAAVVWVHVHAGPSPRSANTALTVPPAAVGARVPQARFAPPLTFERNEGQHARAIRFAARGAGYRFSFLDHGVALGLASSDGQRNLVIEFGPRGRPPVGESPLPARANYFIGRDRSRWRQNVPTFTHVRYPQAYEGVDLVFYGQGQQLEYDVVVAPNADLRAARIALRGADRVRVDDEGSLVLNIGPQELRFTKPVAYQDSDGARQAVDVAYTIEGSDVTFDVGAYDTSRELVIDPVLVFSTYLGGSNNDLILDIAVDATGATYATGYTESMNFPTTAGAAQRSNNGNVDVFVTKLTRDGALVYSTYFGGSGGDLGQGIGVDAKGSAYVVGATRSTDLPTTSGTIQSAYRGGDTDAFVVKFAPSGDRVVYATYLGGTARDDFDIADIAVDPVGVAYVTGTTDSSDFPTTAGALDRTNPAGTRKGYVAKLNAAGSALMYGTFLTGTREQLAKSITLDSQNRAVVAGDISGTMSTTTTLGPVGGRDAFILKLNATGSGLVYSTRFGGSSIDMANGVALDARDGSPQIVGTTYSADFPASSPIASQMVLKGGVDAFAVRLSPDGARRSFASLIGGNGVDEGTAVDVSTHYITVFGTTFSTDFPLRGELQSRNAGNADAFVTRLNYGWHVLFSSYLGGTRGDSVASGAVDGAGQATVAGYTQSRDFPTARPAQATNRSNLSYYEGFIARAAVLRRGAPGPHDVVVHVADVGELHGNWERVSDATGASGARLHNPDAGLAKVTTAAAAPADYFEFTVNGLSGGPYVVYVRGKADNNSFANDSVHLQFSNARNAPDEADNERDIFKIGTTEGMAVSIEDCANCGLHGWGWQDDGYGKKVPGTWLYFNNGLPTTVRVQRREDGISIDQIVLARDENNEGPYLFSAPGYQKDDDTIMPAQDPAPGTGTGDIVLYPGVDGAALHGTWAAVPDSSAAGGTRLRNPDAGAAKLPAPLASPADYFDLTFDARTNVAYRIWIRGKADADSWSNDSAYVQFAGSVTGTGAPQWRIGTTSATTYVLEECTGCGVRGWGWNDNAYGTGALGPIVYFAADGPQTIRIQRREDGLSIDQIVLSPQRFMDAAPGGTKNDGTVVDR